MFCHFTYHGNLVQLKKHDYKTMHLVIMQVKINWQVHLFPKRSYHLDECFNRGVMKTSCVGCFYSFNGAPFNILLIVVLFPHYFYDHNSFILYKHNKQ